VRGCIGGASHWRSCEDYPLAPDRAWPNATAPGQSLLQLNTGTLPPHSQEAYLTQTIHFHTGYGYVAIESAVGFLARINPACNTLSSTNLLTSPHHQGTPQNSLLKYTHSKSFSAHLVTHDCSGSSAPPTSSSTFTSQQVVLQVPKPTISLSTDRASPLARTMKSEPSTSPRWCRDGRMQVFGDGGRIGVLHARR
jgi:hypothetical protein